VKIRQYKESDLQAVLSSWESATRLAHPFMSDEFIAQERRNVADIYLPNTDTWVVELGGSVEGFIALMGNEVGAIFLQPDFHGKGAGKALMDKAQELHGDLEVEVFKENGIGRKFYARYGFEQLEETFHEPTGQQVLRLKYTAHKTVCSNATPSGGPAVDNPNLQQQLDASFQAHMDAELSGSLDRTLGDDGVQSTSRERADNARRSGLGECANVLREAVDRPILSARSKV
jgi:putative acetyltransferase